MAIARHHVNTVTSSGEDRLSAFAQDASWRRHVEASSWSCPIAPDRFEWTNDRTRWGERRVSLADE